MKRKHQLEMQRAVAEIIEGRSIKYILAMVTPGGGKSALPMIAGRLITAGLADALCWVVPRKSLQRQGEANFIDPFFRKLFNHQLTVRASTNDPDPCRGLSGFVTTYQAIGVDDKKTVQEDFARRRYILVLDEFHHAEQDGVWQRALAPLVKRAAFVVMMTGTLERGDGSKIAFIPYAEHIGRVRPVLESSDQLGLRVIRYSRSDALAEKAIIPLAFSFADGSATWMDDTGQLVHHDSLAKTTAKDAARAVYTALSTGYARQLMTMAVKHWRGHRRRQNPRGKLLLVTAGIKHAKAAVNYLKGHGFNAQIATSHESAAAQRAIDKFKAGDIDILVTIAMAYEGLDVPTVSHLVCLTHIRSRPWIEQMLARAVRVDHGAGPWQNQRAHVFCPDDVIMRALVAKIEAEQEPFIKGDRPGAQLELFDERPEDLPAGYGDADANYWHITPLNSSLTGHRDQLLGGADPDLLVPSAPVREKTPSQLEAELREAIEKHVRTYSYLNRYRNGRINSLIRRAMGKSRNKMSLRELEKCHAYVKRTYPLSSKRHIATKGGTL